MLYSIIIVIGKLGVPLSYKYIIEGDLLKSALFNQGLEAGWKISFSLNKYFLIFQRFWCILSPEFF
jgi:hypothetical protein